MKGLLEESRDSDYEFASTARMEKYWSRIFDGESLPREKEALE
jgi:hypothetical protein